MESKLLEAKIGSNLAEIQAIVKRAARISRREPDDVTILAISKRQPNEVIEAAYRCGQRAFGESYVQEAMEKIDYFKKFDDIRWDMVGHIQSRKARQVAENFHTVHSLDSVKLAGLLDKHRPDQMPPLEVFLEVNIGDESSKIGFHGSNEKDRQALLPAVRQIIAMKKLKLVGLMAMPPLFPNPEQSRPYFQKLCQLQDFLNNQVADGRLNQLSAGTSSDFEIAIEEGSTTVRIGERLLGPRIYED